MELLAESLPYGQVVLLYGARTRADLLYTRELEDWRGRFDLEVEVTVDSAAGGWLGHVGTVTTLIPRATFDPRHTVEYSGRVGVIRFDATFGGDIRRAIDEI